MARLHTTGIDWGRLSIEVRIVRDISGLRGEVCCKWLLLYQRRSDGDSQQDICKTANAEDAHRAASPGTCSSES